MAYEINQDQCAGCGVCVDSCPVTAIAQTDGKYMIDAAKCTDCGACAEACPVSCIAKK